MNYNKRPTVILRPILATENPFKMMKNALYVNFKALFVFQIFKFILTFLVR